MGTCSTCWSFFRYAKKPKNIDTGLGTCWVDGTKTRGAWNCGMHSENYPKHHSEVAPDLKEKWFATDISSRREGPLSSQ